jgi:general secretion pathway protein G
MMTLPKNYYGMGILEAVLIGVLISVLMVVFMGKILNLSLAVEREAMQQTLINLNSALNIEALTLVIQNNEEALASWEGGNPMKLLNPPPVQYKGSFSQADAMKQVPGSWFFDEGQAQLIYRINNVKQFAGGRAIPERVRFSVKPIFDDQNNDGYKNSDERYMGLRLIALDEYQWLSNEVNQD